jgi:hypothetical protein
VTIIDTTAPVLYGTPGDITAECDDMPQPAPVTATDNCDSDPTLTFTESREDGGCADGFALTRTWTAEDDWGNQASHTQRITVQDTIPPDLTCSFEPVFDDENPDEQIDGLYRVRFSGVDNCDPAPKILGYVDVYGDGKSCDDETADFVGYPVEDGDIVKLNCSAKKIDCVQYSADTDEESDRGHGRRNGFDVAVEITGPAMKLTVTGEDICGNTSQTECFFHCLNPEDGIHALRLQNSQGEEKTFYWYELDEHVTHFVVGGESGAFDTDCSKCLMVGDLSGTLRITCIYAGKKLAKKCKVPDDYFSTPCPGE